MELWKDIPDYEGKYQVSNMGRVKSFVKNNSGCLLKPGKASHQYYTVALGRNNSKTVHSLVALAFIGVKPKGMEVLHLDGSRDNNMVSNLRYGSRSDNIRDAVKHGRWMTPNRIEALNKGRITRWGKK